MQTSLQITIACVDSALTVRTADDDTPMAVLGALTRAMADAAPLDQNAAYRVAVQALVAPAGPYTYAIFSGDALPAGALDVRIDFTPEIPGAALRLPTVRVNQSDPEVPVHGSNRIFAGDFGQFRRWLNRQRAGAGEAPLHPSAVEAMASYMLERARATCAVMEAEPDCVEIERFWVDQRGRQVSATELGPGVPDGDPDELESFDTLFLHFPHKGRDAVLDVECTERAAQLAEVLASHYRLHAVA